MANMMDYLDWRGDLTFTQDPVNEVDSIIISMLAHIELNGIVPSEHGEGIALRDAAKEYFFTHDEKKKYPLGLIIPKEIITLFRRMADTPRYADLRLMGYVNEICEEREMQFAALTIGLPDGGQYVAFRGTDDTLVGWKEDFRLSYMDVVPSQRKAVQYLNDLPETDGDLYVGGHSKGGNLSVWAAVHAERRVRDRIRRVFSNDGPGFTEGMVRSEAYLAMREKIVFMIPQSSLVGLLLVNDGSYHVVKSTMKGVFQHNPMSWEVMGHQVVRAEALDAKAVRTENLIRERIGRMNNDEKRMMIQMFFKVLDSTGAQTLTELNDGKLRHAFTMIRTVSELDKESKDMALYLITKLFDAKITLEPAGAQSSRTPKPISLPSSPKPTVVGEKEKGRARGKKSRCHRAARARIRVEWRFGRHDPW